MCAGMSPVRTFHWRKTVEISRSDIVRGIAYIYFLGFRIDGKSVGQCDFLFRSVSYEAV